MIKKYQDSEEIIQVPRFEESLGFYTSPQRSNNMSKIRAKNSLPELIFRKALWKQGVRYRTHVKSLPGTPDIVIRKYRLVIFIDGAFWHGYQWEEKKEKLKSNQGFWIPKIERNKQRDRINTRKLKDAGFTVMRFWEHEVKKNLDACINQVMLYIETAKEMKVPETE
ncbi:MAG: very short patch repair endonuclease [Pelobium sp.]